MNVRLELLLPFLEPVHCNDPHVSRNCVTRRSCRRYERFCRLGSGLIQAVRLMSRDHSVLDPEDRVYAILHFLTSWDVLGCPGMCITCACRARPSHRRACSCDCVSDGEELSLQIMVSGDAQHAANRCDHLPHARCHTARSFDMSLSFNMRIAGGHAPLTACA